MDEMRLVLGAYIAIVTTFSIVLEIILFKRVVRIMERSYQILQLTEQHARMTDSQKQRAEQVLGQAKAQARTVVTTAKAVVDEVKAVAEQIPAKVVEEMKRSGDSNDYGPLKTPDSGTQPKLT